MCALNFVILLKFPHFQSYTTTREVHSVCINNDLVFSLAAKGN